METQPTPKVIDGKTSFAGQGLWDSGDISGRCKPGPDFCNEFFLTLRQTAYAVRWVENGGTNSIKCRAVWIVLCVRAKKSS